MAATTTQERLCGVKRKRETSPSSPPRKKKLRRRSFPLERIISGGQTGADRAGLEAAKQLGLATGGTAANGFNTTNGSDRSLRDTYGLVEVGPGLGNHYVRRSMANVDNATGTVAFRIKSSIGTDKTIGYCYTKRWKYAQRHTCTHLHRPVMVVSNFDEAERRALRRFIRRNNVATLNVVGHRQSSSVPGDWSQRVHRFLVEALQHVVVR